MSYDTPQIIFWNAAKASSLGPKCTVPTSNAFDNQQRMLATDTPTTLLAVAMTHYELPGLGLDGRNVDLVQIDAPFRSYLTSARALLRARSLEGLVGNWDRSDGLPPDLDPGLRPGFFGSRFGLSLEKGAAWRLPARRDSSTRSRAWQSGRPVPSTDSEIRVLHVQSTQLALKLQPVRPVREPTVQDLNMHELAGAAAFVQPLP